MKSKTFLKFELSGSPWKMESDSTLQAQNGAISFDSCKNLSIVAPASWISTASISLTCPVSVSGPGKLFCFARPLVRLVTGAKAFRAHCALTFDSRVLITLSAISVPIHYS